MQLHKLKFIFYDKNWKFIKNREVYTNLCDDVLSCIHIEMREGEDVLPLKCWNFEWEEYMSDSITFTPPEQQLPRWKIFMVNKDGTSAGEEFEKMADIVVEGIRKHEKTLKEQVPKEKYEKLFTKIPVLLRSKSPGKIDWKIVDIEKANEIKIFVENNPKKELIWQKMLLEDVSVTIIDEKRKIDAFRLLHGNTLVTFPLLKKIKKLKNSSSKVSFSKESDNDSNKEYDDSDKEYDDSDIEYDSDVEYGSDE